MKKEKGKADFLKEKKLLEQKLVDLLSKSNLKPAEIKLIEEIELNLNALNRKIS